MFYLDEKNSTNPSAGTALDHTRIEISNVPQTSDKLYEIGWVANDLLDLEWTPVTTSYTPVWLKAYTDVANFGSNSTTVATFLLSGALRVQFRGLL